MMNSIVKTPVKAIHLDDNGCVYLLEDGRSYYFNPDRSAGWLYSVPYTGTFETKETDYIKQLIKRDWVCLDIGACFGWYTVLFSQLAGNNGSIHAFEPIPDNRECLDANLSLNGCTNVVVNNYALGEESSITQIYIPLDGVSGSLRAHATVSKCKVLDVKVSTLDQYVSNNGIGRIDFIKADIEGAELLMLKGAKETLKRYHPILMLEIQSHSTKLFGYKPEDVFDFLHEIGYAGFYVTQQGNLELCLPGKQYHHLPDYNFIFHYRQHTE